MAGTFRWLTRLFQSFSKEDKRLAEGIANITGRAPRNLDLYKLAVRHSSFNSGANGEHNERLEFLGDAVLGAVIAEYLFKKFPKRNEGFMTEIRSRLVNGESLGKLATKIGLDQLIQYEGRRKQPHTHRSMNGDAMEALIGAFYLDTDFNTCRTFIIDRLLKPNYDLNEVVESDQNHKSRMIEWAQKNGQKLSFEIPADSGRGSKDFVANVMLDGKLFATGTGFSKKKAEQNAAHAAIKKIKERTDRQERGRGDELQERRPRPELRRTDNRPERSERPDRTERPERAERLERAERPERTDRPDRQDRNRNRPPRVARDESQTDAQQEAQTGNERAEISPRPTRVGRVNQEDLYNDAAPLASQKADGGIMPITPRPDRAERGPRPERRERPPRRNRDGSIKGTEPSSDDIPDPQSWTLETPELDNLTKIDPSTALVSEVIETQTSRLEEESTPQSEETFQVNVQRIQPKAVDVVKPIEEATTQQEPMKRKWVNVSKGEATASDAVPVNSMAKEAFDSISTEADTFMTNMPGSSQIADTPKTDESESAT